MLTSECPGVGQLDGEITRVAGAVHQVRRDSNGIGVDAVAFAEVQFQPVRGLRIAVESRVGVAVERHPCGIAAAVLAACARYQWGGRCIARHVRGGIPRPSHAVAQGVELKIPRGDVVDAEPDVPEDGGRCRTPPNPRARRGGRLGDAHTHAPEPGDSCGRADRRARGQQRCKVGDLTEVAIPGPAACARPRRPIPQWGAIRFTNFTKC